MSCDDTPTDPVLDQLLGQLDHHQLHPSGLCFDPQAGRVTASDQGPTLTVAGGGSITASTVSRTLGGMVVRYGVPGRTSRGLLRVARGALRFPADPGWVKLTREHNRDESRGHLVAWEDTGDGIRASLRVSDGPEGDAALREANDRTRDGFSFDIVDATIDGDTITDALVVAIGQVGIPAYDTTRIDSIAANQQHQTMKGTPMLTPAQQARMAELLNTPNRTAEQDSELQQLQQLAAGGDQSGGDQSGDQSGQPQGQPDQSGQPQGQPDQGDQGDQGGQSAGGATGGVQASSFPAVPGGVPRPGVTTRPQGGHLAAFAQTVVDAIRGGGGAQAITAALADVTYTAHSDVIQAPAWSGELWSGLSYTPEFSDLFAAGTLTAMKGVGWRFTQKLVMQDYAGDKVAIPTSNVTTEPAEYTAARMAVGVDVDRAFYDFPNAGFVQALAEQARESWAMKLDAKILAFVLAEAVAAEGAAAQPSLLKAAAVAVRALKRRRVGRATFVVVNDDDMFSLIDLTNDDVPAFLELYGIDPRNFRSSQDVPAGTVIAGVRQAATLRTLPGSPIRVSAQHIANGGIDEAFFGYWAVEQHHLGGIASATYTAPV